MAKENLQGIADTLYIPLVARISVSKQFPDFFCDEKALSLESSIPEKWKHIMEAAKEYENMAAVARYFNFDDMTRKFMAAHERCNIVNLGAGLDTGFHRLQPTKAVFYEVDLPEVIDVRRKVLGEHDGEVLLGGDMFDLSWATAIDCTLPTLLMASGVFQYFPHARLHGFIRDLKKTFPKGELAFDATTRIGIEVANYYVRRLGNRDAHMPFYINSSKAFARKTDTVLMENRPFFTDLRRILGPRLKRSTRFLTFWGDLLNMSRVIHLKLNAK
ncbi:MAG: class I SAM-dependent methyltransferase [Prevotella sp.]|nr:class I SAM-dependent methyltransferase [Prevotella sp.]